MPAKPKPDFAAVHAQLKTIMQKYAGDAVYVFPDLLDGVSPELKKHMQGKSCFNFKTVDDRLFKELARLTDKGYKRFKREELIG